MKNNNIIFFDVDDTLYDNRNNRIPQKSEESLKTLKKAGYTICLATGRELNYIPNSVSEIFPWDGYICCNGQCIYDKKKNILRQIFFDQESLYSCMKIADDTNSTLEIRSTEGNYVYNYYTEAYEKACRYLNRPLWKKASFKSTDQITMMMIARDITENYSDLMQIHGIVVAPTSNYYADINSCMCSKYEGIRYYMKLFGYDSYIAIGDSLNDFEMLKYADCSIAMGNAQQKIKNICDYVTDSVSAGGIAKIVDFLLR